MMKTYWIILCLVNLMMMNSDSLEIHYKKKIQHGQIAITWESAVVEQAIEPDGKPGAHAVSINILLESVNKKSVWELILPADYQDFFKQQPEQVTYLFESFSLRITDADFTTINNGFIRLEVVKGL